MSRTIPTVIGTVCLFLTGCGTFSDCICGPGDHNVLYRGVRLDISAIKQGGKLTLLAADIPFSAIADTLLIPYYIQLHQTREAAIRERSERKAIMPMKLDNPDPMPPPFLREP